MSVADQTPIAGYTGNGVTTAFSFPFAVLAEGDVSVMVAGLLLTLNVHYTVSGVGGASGTVTFTSPPASLASIVIYRDSDLTRDTDYQDNGDLLAATLNRDLDRLWLALQEVLAGGKVSPRSVRAPIGETLSDLPAAAVRAGRILSFNIATGDVDTVAPVEGTATALAIQLASTAVGDGAATVGFKSPLSGAADRTVYLNLLQKKNLSNWCDGNGADETSQIAAAIAACNAAGVAVLECATDANYVFTGQQTLADRLSIAGNGCTFTPANDGFRTAGGASDIGLTFYRDFRMMGSSSSANTALAIAQNTTLSRTQGVRFENLLIDRFMYGIHGRSMWHSTVDKCRIMRSKFGVAYIGQCVSGSISKSQIVSSVAVYGDGSVGVLVDQYAYAVGGTLRPEAINICDETLVYGFDTNVYATRCLHFTVADSDIDAALKYGVRCTTIDGGININGNYIAGLHNGNPVLTAIQIDDLGAANTSSINVKHNDIFFSGTPGAGAVGIYIGTLRTGKKIIAGNNIGQGAGVETAVSMTSVSGADFSSNYLVGSSFSLKANNGGNNKYSRNTFNGPISRTGTRTKDQFDRNDGTAVTGFHGLITYPATVTTATLGYVADLGLSAAPVTGAPANLVPYVVATQVSGGTSQGFLRARDNAAGSIIVDRTTGLGGPSADIWVDVEST